jgi:hypothetical protein
LCKQREFTASLYIADASFFLDDSITRDDCYFAGNTQGQTPLSFKGKCCYEEEEKATKKNEGRKKVNSVFYIVILSNFVAFTCAITSVSTREIHFIVN